MSSINWWLTEISLKPRPQGFHLVSQEIVGLIVHLHKMLGLESVHGNNWRLR